MPFRLKLLGGPSVERNGTPLAGRSTQRRRVALLALLAVARQAGLARDKLLAYLWPERDVQLGRHSLSQTLYAIRQDLGPDALISRVDDVRLNPAMLSSDLWEFEDAKAAGDLQGAAAAYTGPFLDGFFINDAPEFERWTESERQRLAGDFAEVVEGLAREAARRGDRVGAGRWWQRRAELDPLDSRVAVALMNALAAGGNRAGAIQHARFHASLLAQELGVGPNPAVAALAQQLARESGITPQEAPPDAADRGANQQARLQASLGERFRVERELGSGGMATIYLAEDLRHGRRVAVKVLKPEVAAALGTERFLREIGVAARLEHPHILPLFDSGTLPEDGNPTGFYYVTPYVSGESLRHRLRRDRQLAVDEAVRIAREAAAALGHAHAHGIVHRDLKPENILLQDGSVLVADFGLARAVDAAGRERLTATGIAVGTPHYMSPEQATGSPELDARSDLYSLGCVLYEMLAGEPPFSGPTAQAIMARHAVDPVPPLRTVRAAVPPALERTVMRALEKTPADRFADARELLLALERSSALQTTPTEVTQPIARRRIWRPAVVSLGLLAAFSSRWLWLRSDRLDVPSAASVIAVLPLSPVTPDTALARLGRDLAVTVSANLDGVGGIRTVDPQTLLSQPAVAASGPAEDLRLGRRFGAGSVFRGTLRRERGQVRLELGLFVTDTSRSDDPAPLARLALAGSIDSVAALTDSITWGLLRAIWRRDTPPSPSLDVALRTRSVSALRAFLRGEQYLVSNRWAAAAQAYREATVEDSTFWLAYWRAGFARSWLQHGEEDTAMARVYWAHRAELPERDRLMIEFGRADSLSAQLALGQRITSRYPDSWLGWLLYGDALVHGGPLVGHARTEAREVLSTTIGRNPRLIAARDHWTWLALQDGDTLGSGNALRTLDELGAGPALYEEYDEDELRELRLLDRVRRGDSLAARSLMDSIVRDGSSMNPATPFWYGFFGTQIEVSRGNLRWVADGPAVPFHLAMIALSFAGRGAWDSALISMDRYAGSAVSPSGAQAAYRLAVTGVWLGALDEGAAHLRRQAAQRERVTLGPDAEAELLWLDGVLAASSGNRVALADARERLRALHHPGTAAAEQSLAAFGLAADGRRAEAGRALARLEWSRAEHWNRGEWRNQALLPINRLAASEWLLEAGDTLTAARLLRWHEAYSGSVWTAMLMPIAYLRRAELEHRQGHLPVAARYYREFLFRYDMPTPRTLPLVQRAASALARLG